MRVGRGSAGGCWEMEQKKEWMEEQHFSVLPQASSVYVRQKGTGLRRRRWQILEGNIQGLWSNLTSTSFSESLWSLQAPHGTSESHRWWSHAGCVSIRSPETRRGEAGIRSVFQHRHCIVRASLPVVGTKVGQAGFAQRTMVLRSCARENERDICSRQLQRVCLGI